MRLYLVRHGIADERDPERWPDDAERPLTEEGERRLRRMAEGVRILGLQADAAVSSPLLRARQTAEILAPAFGVREPVHLTPGLAPGGPRERLWHDLDAAAGPGGSLALVGHEPDLSELLGDILRVSGLALDWRKGGIAEVLVEDLPPRSPGTLLAFTPPRWLREIPR